MNQRKLLYKFSGINLISVELNQHCFFKENIITNKMIFVTAKALRTVALCSMAIDTQVRSFEPLYY